MFVTDERLRLVIGTGGFEVVVRDLQDPPQFSSAAQVEARQSFQLSGTRSRRGE